MQDEWLALGWSEAREQAKEEKWALRVLTCARKSCRRRRRCKREWPVDPRCPGYAAFPDSKDEYHEYNALLRRMLKRSVAEGDADPVAADIAKAARDRREEERRALAFQRVSARLKAGERAEEIFGGWRGGHRGYIRTSEILSDKRGGPGSAVTPRRPLEQVTVV